MTPKGCRSVVAQRRAARALWYRQIAAAAATLRLSAPPAIGIRIAVCRHRPPIPRAGHGIRARTATRRPGQIGVVQAGLAVDGGGQHAQARIGQRGNRSPRHRIRTPPGSRRCCRPRRAGTFRCRGRHCGRPARPRPRPSRRRSGSACPHCRAPRSRRRRRPAAADRPARRPGSSTALSHTATSPTGVTVSDKAFAARSVTRWTGTSPSIGPKRLNAASVTNTSITRSRRNAASTRLGPSARKRAARRRPTWRCSLIAAATRSERSVSVRQPRRTVTARSRPRAARPWRRPPAR